MKRMISLTILCLTCALGFAKSEIPKQDKDGGNGPTVLSVYHYTNDVGKRFEFHVVSQADYRLYCNDYARTWSDAADDCIPMQGDCMDDVVITPSSED